MTIPSSNAAAACLLFCYKHIYLCPSDQIPILNKSYLNSHTFIHCPTYLIFYPCCNWVHLQCAFHIPTISTDMFVYWLSVMKTCKLFVVQIQNWFDYARYILRSFHFVQNGKGMQAIVSWLHMEFNGNANANAIWHGYLSFLASMLDRTEQKQQRPPVCTLSFICTDDANSSFI